ncbi:branched-chain amino acid ABC transporter permease [Microbacterium amylolyticum]|uniref:Branched-chain amino acid transport system permease protein n=1 Tax=Microbacterium amylolyticum TaxID=936337 RepID=A0ABS4ZJE2_9MICO|nr:branched-chain amino acid ABC transporter permease [Microbacterium amylolyticum]MBP2437413.1 branched-chain amino acid transport system permease protein [Microbacterium amylolyticum]
MTSPAAPRGRARTSVWRAVIVSLLTLLTVFALGATPAAAAEGDPYRIAGLVQLNGDPLEGVSLVIDGSGGEQSVVTGSDGRWEAWVPDNDSEYTVTLDESTLPDGIGVVDEDTEIAEGEQPNVRDVTVGAAGFAVVNFFIGDVERNTVSFADQLIQRIFQGLNFGLMLALAAIGLSLVYGTTRLSNFAHAEMVTFGAVVAVGVSSALASIAVSPAMTVLGLLIAIGLAGGLGYALDMALWRPLRRRGVGIVQLMIVSIGLSLAMRFTFQFFIGGSTLQLPTLVSTAKVPIFGAVALSPMEIVSMSIALVVIVAFALWLTYSRIGKATRAISDNPALASATGIDVDRVVRIIWVVAGALAGLGGILYAYYRPGVRFDMGMHILLLMFAAVTLGGLGTAYGALIGSLIIGVIVEVVSLWIPADLRFVPALLLLIVILLVRPQGLLGRRERIG